MSVLRPRILLVDSDLESLGPCSEALRRAGYEVAIAFTSEEGLNLARHQRFDLAIVAWNLPGLDGYQVLALLKDIDPAIEVILTGKDPSRDDLIKAMRKRAADFVAKPVNSSELRTAIERALAYRARLKISPPAFAPETASRLHTLSEREAEVLSLMSQGLGTREIAERLSLSLKTIRNHIAAVYTKLGVKSRTQAVLVLEASKPVEKEVT